MSFFKKAFGNTAQTLLPNSGELDVGLVAYGDQPYSGRRMTRMRALQAMAVWRCIDIVSTGIATLPGGVFARDKNGIPTPRDTPLWLAKPAPWQTPTDFWHRVMVSMLTEGNAFIWTQRNQDTGQIIGLRVLDPYRVAIYENDDRTDIEFVIDGVPFDRSFILWIPSFTVDWQLRGLSPIEAARQAVDLGLTIEEFGAKFFHQGTSMAGVIKHPGTPSKDEAELLRDMFRKKHSGVSNSHAIGVLTGGADWQNITITPEQAQFLETRKYQNAEIALMYGVPPYLVDSATRVTWGTGIEEQNSFFLIFCLQKYIVKIEQAFSLFLLPGKQEFRFNTDARLQPDTAARYQAYEQAINSGWMNRDEVRAKENLEPIPDGLGQTFYRPLNYTPLGVGPYEDNGELTDDDPADNKGALPGAGETVGEVAEPDGDETGPGKVEDGGKKKS